MGWEGRAKKRRNKRCMTSYVLVSSARPARAGAEAKALSAATKAEQQYGSQLTEAVGRHYSTVKIYTQDKDGNAPTKNGRSRQRGSTLPLFSANQQPTLRRDINFWKRIAETAGKEHREEWTYKRHTTNKQVQV